MTFVVAIDGPAGSGKSTTARAVADRLQLAHLDSGALYRAITLLANRAGGAEPSDLSGLLGRHDVRLTWEGGRYVPMIDGVDVAGEVRGPTVTARVSTVAALPVVRDYVNAGLRRAAREHPRGVVVDGRDIGTVVFPTAAVKVFLTANVEERARRRSREEAQHTPSRVRELAEEIRSRDAADSNRAVAPLRPAEDAVHLDTTGLSFPDQVERVVQLVRKALP